MSRPITPEDARNHASPIPDLVFDVFNKYIAQGAGIRSVTFKQDDVVNALEQHGFNRSEIFEKHWLDVEAIYEAAGWKVTYDKPGYNESYDATFTFTPNREQKR